MAFVWEFQEYFRGQKWFGCWGEPRGRVQHTGASEGIQRESLFSKHFRMVAILYNLVIFFRPLDGEFWEFPIWRLGIWALLFRRLGVRRFGLLEFIHWVGFVLDPELAGWSV